jgi:O-antigen ligase
LALGLGIFGYALDLRLRKLRPEATPQLLWMAVLLGAAVLGLLEHDPVQLKPVLARVVPGLVLYLLVAHGVQSFRALQALAALVLAGGLFVSLVAAEQAAAPRGCFKAEEGRLGWDGRACTGELDCERGDGVDYSCEHLGLVGTQSLEGRPRYLGWLSDPDQLALAVVVALPFAFAFFERKRSLGRGLLSAAALALAIASVILTRSRGGLLALLAALGVQAARTDRVKRMGLWAALAVFLWSAGGGDAMSASFDEGWYEGMLMFLRSPLLGVGIGQFTEHHVHLAQNSFVGAAAELGLLGFVPWTAVLYLSVKVPLAGLRRLEEPVARAWAWALLSSWCGLLVGLFFRAAWRGELFWIFTGLSGAFFASTRTHDPAFEVRLGWRDLLGLLCADAIVLGGLTLFTRQ